MDESSSAYIIWSALYHDRVSYQVYNELTEIISLQRRTSRRIFAEFATDEAANKMIKDNSLDNYGDHPVSRAKITHNAMTASLFSSSKRNFSYITKFKTLFSGQSKPKVRFLFILRFILIFKELYRYSPAYH